MSFSINGRKAEYVWNECLAKYRDGSLPSTVTTDTPRPVDCTEPTDIVSSSRHDAADMETKPDEIDDDIDALLSSAETFVRDQKTSVSSLIGLHSAVGTGPQLPFGQNSSVNARSDVPFLADRTNTVDRETGAASESLSSYASTKDTAGGNKFPRRTTGQIHCGNFVAILRLILIWLSEVLLLSVTSSCHNGDLRFFHV